MYTKLCLIIQICCKTSSIEYVLPKTLYKWCGWKINHWQCTMFMERSAQLLCPCKATSLFLKQDATSNRARTIDHLMYVLRNVSVSLCALSGTFLTKCCLYVHLSPSHPSITTLGKHILHSQHDLKQEVLRLNF